ncbi:MAG: hypothetical protein EBR02_02830 [Alphaproteobacteria bacterium]|nr:hypothetical protein [Alphaproteobacteria bacterium]
MQAPKACSGKCMGSCAKASRVWVVAACEGMLSLFEKKKDGHLRLMPQSDHSLFPSLEVFRDMLLSAEERNLFDQLIIVGSGNDIAWVQMSLPSIVSKRIVAEIQYPLVVGWFRQGEALPQLTQALENVFTV